MKDNVLPARPYQLFFEHRPGYLYAFVSCETISFDIARGYWIEILSMLRRRHYGRVLIEKNVRQRLAAHEVYTLVSGLAHSGYNEISFAIYDHRYDAEKSSFEEMVGTNRGLRVKIFPDLPSTEQWLNGQPENPAIRRSHFLHSREAPALTLAASG